MKKSLTRTRSLFPFGPLWDDLFNTGLELAGREERAIAIRLDVVETPDAVVVSAELPGVAKENVDVSIEDGVLTISGEKSATEKRDGDSHLVVERRYGSFHRTLTLATTVDTDAAEARFENGLLTIRLPKHEQVKPRKLDIE